MSNYVLLHKKQVDLGSVELVTLADFRANHRAAIHSFSSGPVGLDFESNTYDYCAPDYYVRTVGLANGDHCYSIDCKGASEEDLAGFKKWLLTLEYIAHNAMMEEGTLQTWAGGEGKPIADTYLLYADLATEERRSLGLEAAMQDLLGEEKQGDKIKEHMKTNNWTWADVDKFDFKILGFYNAVDAWGAFELFVYFNKIIGSHRDTWGQYYWQYHREDCLNEVKLQIEARINGIHVKTQDMEESYISLCAKRDEAFSSFLGDESVGPNIAKFNIQCISEHEARKPEKFTKTGKVAARYTKWEEKLEEIKNTQHFNPNSTKQLRWLFFDRMGIEPVEFTETGEPSTSAACLKKMGPQAKLLLEYRGYITQLKFLTQVREGQKDGVIRPFVRMFATLTTRCGAGRLE